MSDEHEPEPGGSDEYGRLLDEVKAVMGAEFAQRLENAVSQLVASSTTPALRSTYLIGQPVVHDPPPVGTLVGRRPDEPAHVPTLLGKPGGFGPIKPATAKVTNHGSPYGGSVDELPADGD